MRTSPVHFTVNCHWSSIIVCKAGFFFQNSCKYLFRQLDPRSCIGVQTVISMTKFFLVSGSSSDWCYTSFCRFPVIYPGCISITFFTARSKRSVTQPSQNFTWQFLDAVWYSINIHENCDFLRFHKCVPHSRVDSNLFSNSYTFLDFAKFLSSVSWIRTTPRKSRK